MGVQSVCHHVELLWVITVLFFARLIVDRLSGFLFLCLLFPASGALSSVIGVGGGVPLRVTLRPPFSWQSGDHGSLDE